MLALAGITIGVGSNYGAAQTPSVAHSGTPNVTKSLCIVLLLAPVAPFWMTFAADEPGKLPEVLEQYTTCAGISTRSVY